VSDKTTTVIVTTAVGLGVLLVLRWLLRHAVGRYLMRFGAKRGPDEVASMQTRLTVLTRLVVAFVGLIVVWQALSVYEITGKLANAVLASSAVLGVLSGVAFSVPLGNLGAGIMLAFSQPVRIGDRVTVEGLTGTTEEITLSHTILLTDEDRRVFVPNSRMVSGIVVNRSIKDPRRWVTATLPIPISASLERAKVTVAEAVRASETLGPLDLVLRVDDVSGGAVLLTVTLYAEPGADVPALTSELRERAVIALAREGLLAA
jgi:small conductance mechanosensitive channel